MTIKKKIHTSQSKKIDQSPKSFILRYWFLIILVLGLVALPVLWKSFTLTTSPNTSQSHIEELETKITNSSESVAKLAARIEAMEKLIADNNHENSLAQAQRLDGIEKNLAKIQEDVKKQNARGSLGISPLITAFANLAFQLFSSAPYEAELERLQFLFRSLAPALNISASRHFSSLATYASQGIPSIPALQRSFDRAVLSALKKSKAPEDLNWWSHTLSRLKGLVVIRRLDHTVDSSAEIKFRDVEIKLAAGQLDEAINIVELLPKQERIFFEPWLVQARSRQSAINSYRSLVKAVS